MGYFPYGQENTPAGANNTCSNSCLFTGYEHDSDTGLDYAFARYYNSREARFMSADPLGGDITDPQTLNKYAYVRNNPVNLVDPFGAVPQIQLPPLTYNAPPQPPAGYLDWVFGEANSSSTPFVSHWRPPAPPPPPPPPKKPQTESYADCVKNSGNEASLQAGLKYISGGRLGNGWLASAFLGNPISDAIQFFMGNGSAASVAGNAVSIGAPSALRAVPNVSFSYTSMTVTATASGFSAVASRIEAYLPLGDLASGAADVLEGFGYLVQAPVDITASTFGAVTCAAGE